MRTDINGKALPAIYSKIPTGYGDVLDREKQELLAENDALKKKAKMRTAVTVAIAALILAVLVAGLCYFLKISPYWKWAVIYGFTLIPTIILAIKIRHSKNEKEAAEINEKAAYYRRRKNAYRNNLRAYEILDQAIITNFSYGGGHATITYKLSEEEKPKIINLEYVPYEGPDDDFPDEFLIFYKDHVEARGGNEEELKFSTTFMGD